MSNELSIILLLLLVYWYESFTVADHQFEITVEDIRGLSIFKSTVWGETDCYVQYHFPSQIQNTNDFDNEGGLDLINLLLFYLCYTKFFIYLLI
jgi:hypothetical protein